MTIWIAIFLLLGGVGGGLLSSIASMASLLRIQYYLQWGFRQFMQKEGTICQHLKH